MHDNYNGAYSETCETTKMEFFARIVNGRYLYIRGNVLKYLKKVGALYYFIKNVLNKSINYII